MPPRRPADLLIRRCFVGGSRWIVLLATIATLVLTPLAASGGGPASAKSAQHAGSSEVRIHDRSVLTLSEPGAMGDAQERAARASKLLTAEVHTQQKLRLAVTGGKATLHVGDVLVLELSEADARAAGNTSLDQFAKDVARDIEEGLSEERTRKSIADTVFSTSLVIFLGLVTFYLLRKAGRIERSARARLEARTPGSMALRVHSVEVLSAGAIRLIATVGLGAFKWLVRGVVLYSYLVVVTTLFASTRGYADKLISWVLGPTTALAERVAVAIPVFVVVLVALTVVWLGLRLSGLFFASVARGETELSWLRRDVAHSVDVLLRIGIVVLALVFAAPLVTGDKTGAFAQVGEHLLSALSLAAAPILASAGLGAVLVLRRHVRLGDQLQVGTHSGTVKHLGFVDFVLESESGELRIPYLLALWSPLSVLTKRSRLCVRLSVDPAASQKDVIEKLREVVRTIHEEGSVSLLGIDQFGAHYRLCVPHSVNDGAIEHLLLEASEALRLANIGLGHAAPAASR